MSYPKFLNITRDIDIIVRCTECNNAKSFRRFDLDKILKLTCSGCQSKFIQVFLPYRLNDDSNYAYLDYDNREFEYDHSAFENYYQNPETIKLNERDFKAASKKDVWYENGKISWNIEYENGNLLLHADTRIICMKHKEILSLFDSEVREFSYSEDFQENIYFNLSSQCRICHEPEGIRIRQQIYALADEIQKPDYDDPSTYEGRMSELQSELQDHLAREISFDSEQEDHYKRVCSYLNLNFDESL